MQVDAVPLSAIGPEWDALFGPGVQSSRLWFGVTTEAALPPGAQARFLLCRDNGRPAAILPLLVGPGHRVRGLSTVYTCLYQPLVAPSLPPQDIRRAGAALGLACRRWPLLTLDALDPDWPGLPPLLAGFQDGGWVPQRYDHFGNWYEPVRGLSFDDYLAARPGQLRETVRRKTRACARDGRVRFELVRSVDGLGAAAAAYEEVYGRSWKVPEPFPDFTPALLQHAAAAGILRLGVMWVGSVPVASQYWLVSDGTATVQKLAHDDAWRALSPGTVLTAKMIEAVMHDHVDSLDFGRGDDAYKALWTGERRQRVGVLLCNPRRALGALALIREVTATIIRRRAPTNPHRSVRFTDTFTSS